MDSVGRPSEGIKKGSLRKVEVLYVRGRHWLISGLTGFKDMQNC